MIPKVCFICGEEHPRRKTKRYVVRRPGKPAVERAVELCKEHGEPFERILSSPARGTKHRLKAYKSFAEFERAKVQVARPRTEVGDHGRITTTPYRKINGQWRKVGGGKPQRWRARVRIRDVDGVLRDVERWRDTRSEAVEALLKALGPRMS